jgi:beta-carotene ketolase (CrtO type)
MPKDERYDFVIVGGGPNGVTLAAYLAKSGASVCVLEERPEAGGACENTEPIAGVKINPHAIMLYGAPAPGFEQLELQKYGWRIDENEMGDLMADADRGVACSFGMSSLTEKDQMGFAKMSGLLAQPSFTKELLRSVFWCPPHPPEVEMTIDNIPYMQVYKKYQPDVWTEEMLDMDLFDLMDEHLESEPWKVQQAVVAWYSGAAGHWKGVAVPAWACAITLLICGRMRVPRGGMHDYFHCVMRCALAHGVVVRTCCPVDEIMLNDGVAVGVRLRDTAAMGSKKIWANKAVISGVDVRQTFNKLVGPSHVDRGLLQKVNDISLKGGSIFNFHFYTRERLEPRKPWAGKFLGGGYPQDSREIYYDHVADVDGRKGNPTVPPERALWLSTPYVRFERTDKQVTRPEGHIMSPVYFLVPPPEYHVDGPDAINKIKDQLTQYIIKAMSGPYENLNSDNIINVWTNSPYDSEFRNTGLIGGTWCGTRHCHDQWAENRPVPELARYRTPIDGLYLCNQTSCHPGGLFLQAIPYNLMHILIEDGLVEPGPWWYSSPYYIPQQGKKSAKRPQ